jgi:hypothetical protein
VAVTTVCVAPSEALGAVFSGTPLGLVNRLMGELAERLIELDYKTQRPGTIFVDHYFDNPITSSYIAFLAVHNASLRNAIKLSELAILSSLPGGGISRPDILTDKANVQELYEIKPDSSEGLKEGRAKLFAIGAFMGLFGLPYTNGVTFVPTVSTLLASGKFPTISGSVPFKLHLSVRRTIPGLLQYQVCVETDFAAIGATVLGIIAAIIAAILLRGAKLPSGSPLPAPILT